MEELLKEIKELRKKIETQEKQIAYQEEQINQCTKILNHINLINLEKLRKFLLENR